MLHILYKLQRRHIGRFNTLNIIHCTFSTTMRFITVFLIVLASFLATQGAPIETSRDAIPSDWTTLMPLPSVTPHAMPSYARRRWQVVTVSNRIMASFSPYTCVLDYRPLSTL
ncbi:hypothetical protein BDZ89DRAFT_214351 [Hymenopellis radicata]|nr:hypothetical protein BDZ89DRAFT_214351 [Hymenopellis radicata]